MTDYGQIDELKKLCPEVHYAEEGGHHYYLISNLQLPDGCTPQLINVLLCPDNREGYHSRLFFESRVESGKQMNWNSDTFRILERSWHVFSWQLPEGLRLAQMLTSHLRGLTC